MQPDDHLSRILQEMAQVHPEQWLSQCFISIIFAMLRWLSSLGVEVCNANVGVLSSPTPASSAQPG